MLLSHINIKKVCIILIFVYSIQRAKSGFNYCIRYYTNFVNLSYSNNLLLISIRFYLFLNLILSYGMVMDYVRAGPEKFFFLFFSKPFKPALSKFTTMIQSQNQRSNCDNGPVSICVDITDLDAANTN